MATPPVTVNVGWLGAGPECAGTSGGAGAGRAEGTDARRCGEVRSTTYGVVTPQQGAPQ